MCAIEKITSKTKEIKLAPESGDEQSDKIEVPVWNGTVANLTLMALGKLVQVFVVLYNRIEKIVTIFDVFDLMCTKFLIY